MAKDINNYTLSHKFLPYYNELTEINLLFNSLAKDTENVKNNNINERVILVKEAVLRCWNKYLSLPNTTNQLISRYCLLFNNKYQGRITIHGIAKYDELWRRELSNLINKSY